MKKRINNRIYFGISFLYAAIVSALVPNLLAFGINIESPEMRTVLSGLFLTAASLLLSLEDKN